MNYGKWSVLITRLYAHTAKINGVLIWFIVLLGFYMVIHGIQNGLRKEYILLTYTLSQIAIFWMITSEGIRRAKDT